MKKLSGTLQELTPSEMQNTNGGIGPLAVVAGFVGFGLGLAVGWGYAAAAYYITH